jgi:hypothetical protein
MSNRRESREEHIQSDLFALYEKIIPYFPYHVRVGKALKSKESFLGAFYSIYNKPHDLPRLKIAEYITGATENEIAFSAQLWMGWFSEDDTKTDLVCFEVVHVAREQEYGDKYSRWGHSNVKSLLGRDMDGTDLFFLGFPTVPNFGTVLGNGPSKKT